MRLAKAAVAGSTSRKRRHAILCLALAVQVSLGLGASSALAAAPTVSTTTVSAVTTKTAVLEADVNPEGEATTYHFEYGPSDCAVGPCTSVPVPDGNVGAGTSAVRIAKEVSGLAPDTTYHFRIVASNASGVTPGPDRTFTTYAPAPAISCPNAAFRVGPAANLPDCRAYEMVSPIEKNGGDIATGPNVGNFRTAYTQSTPDGDKITYSSIRSFGDAPSGPWTNQYIASRGSGGWSSHGISAPQDTTIFDPFLNPFFEFAPYYHAFTADLSSGWVRDFNEVPLQPDGQAGYANLYRHDNLDDSFETLTVNPPAGSPQPFLGFNLETLEVQGISDDGSHAVFAAHARLTPDAAETTTRQVYDFTGGQLELVSVLPGGEAATTHANVGSYRGTATLVGNWRASAWHNAVSDDGSRIFWSAGEELYARIDGTTTVPISPGPGQFWTATPEGSEVLYSTGNLGSGGATLFVRDVDTEVSTPIAGGVYGVAGASEDLSYIYFASQEALDVGATAGQPNLYVRHGGTTSFIATLTTTDVGQQNNRASIVSREPAQHSSRVTPDGAHLAFQSTRSLTGYDNTDAVSGKPDLEVFRYDAVGNLLTCVSCNPSGARPRGRAMPKMFGIRYLVESGGRWAAAWLPTEEASLYSSRALSEDGNRVYFNSFDALLPQDTNGAQDVYQWEAQGSGTCERASGCLSLISTGQSPEASQFIDASPEGRDIFFETQSSIHPHDPGLIDIYDARAGGGYPPPPPAPVPCLGDACQSVPAPPNDATPASASFRGAGDPAPKRPRRNCRTRGRKAKGNHRQSRAAKAKRCRRSNRRAGR